MRTIERSFFRTGINEAYTIVFIMQISNNVTVGYIIIILSMLEH